MLGEMVEAKLDDEKGQQFNLHECKCILLPTPPQKNTT